MNQDILQKITNQDYISIATRIQNGLQEKIEETNSKGVILGLSGGIDSAVIAYLCNNIVKEKTLALICLLYTSPSPRDATLSRMPSSA